jgi:hypothetical protein
MRTLQGVFNLRTLIWLFNWAVFCWCVIFTISGEFRFALLSYVGFKVFKVSVTTMLGQWINKDHDAGSVGTRLKATALGFVLLVAADWLIRTGGLYSVTIYGVTLSLPFMAFLAGFGGCFIGMHKRSFQP